jgi:hypothetical protein
MLDFSTWCEFAEHDVANHHLGVMKGRAQHLAAGRAMIAKLVPDHYASEEHIARALERLGKQAAADFIRGKLPITKNIRSGDLGEILATEYIDAHTDFAVPIKRLRWKDHRNMAMRGDDVIGLDLDAATQRLRFLKAESKSRVSLTAGVVAEAREVLEKDGGLPSPHALSFVSARLLEAGDTGLCDAIDEAQLKHGITADSVTHLLFTFSGNDPADFLEASLEAYAGDIAQSGIGLHVTTHGDFIADIYDQVIADALDD